MLERTRTDLWIADTISQVGDGDLMRVIKLLQSGLDRAFRPARVVDPVPYHAVIISGFHDDGNAFQAFNALIANSPDERSPSRRFAVEVYHVPPGQMALTQAPCWIKPKSFAALNRSIERAAARGVTFSGGTDILARAIRDVAGQHQEVGVDLIAASIPVPATPTLGEASIGLGRPDDYGGSFEYLSPSRESTHFAPTMILNGIEFRDVVEYHSS